MKLMFFVGSLMGGGAERVMANLCNELVDRGHEVYLVTNKLKTFAYEVDERINTIHLLPENYSSYSKIVSVPMLYKHIRSIVKQIKPDVITSFIYKLNVHVILSTMGMKIPVVASEHSPFDRTESWLSYIYRYYINRIATRTILLTQHDYNYVGKRLKNKIVIPNPLSFPIFYKNSVRKKNVLAVGSIDRWKIKGFDNLIKIWGKISKKHPEWTLEIAGDGSDSNFDYLKSLIEENDVNKSVIFSGFQKQLDILLQQSSIFILSSRYEGLPMVLLEAMSQGCSCIAFDVVSGPKEIITHNKSGLIVENQNLEEMEIMLDQLITDDNLRERLSKGALKEVERFTPKVIGDKWEDLFNSLK